MHRSLSFLTLSVWLLILELSVLSEKITVHALPTSEIFTKTQLQLFINTDSIHQEHIICPSPSFHNLTPHYTDFVGHRKFRFVKTQGTSIAETQEIAKYQDLSSAEEQELSFTAIIRSLKCRSLKGIYFYNSGSNYRS